MNVSGQTIITPLCDPVRYQPDWRSRIIGLCPEFRDIPLPLRRDAFLLDVYTKYKLRTSAGEMFAYVQKWRWTEIGAAIEASLLTEAATDDISLMLGIDKETLRMYRLLYWDIRDSSDRVLKGVLTRIRLSLQDEVGDALFMKRAALLGGFPLLRQVLSPVPVDAGDGSSTVAMLAQRELLHRVLAGACSASDLSRVIATDIIRQQHSHGTENDPNVIKLRKQEELLAAIFKLMQPEKFKAELSEEQRTEMNMALEAKLAAQGNISQAEVFDRGLERGRELVNKIFDRTVNIVPGQELTIGQLR